MLLSVLCGHMSKNFSKRTFSTFYTKKHEWIKIEDKKGNAITTKCQSQNCILKSNKSFHVPNLDISFNKLTGKDRRDIKTAVRLGCNWIALSYLQNEKLILETRKLIKKDMGIISKIENKHALKNIKKIMQKIICL